MEVKKLLDIGIIGEVKNFSSEMYGATVLKNSKSSWRGKRKTGGGCMYEFASHCIDLTVYLLGKPDRVVERRFHAPAIPGLKKRRCAMEKMQFDSLAGRQRLSRLVRKPGPTSTQWLVGALETFGARNNPRKSNALKVSWSYIRRCSRICSPINFSMREMYSCSPSRVIRS